MAGDELLIDEEDEPDPELNRITNAIIGAAIEVHRLLGPGFPESVYDKAMRLELTRQNIPFVSQASVQVVYKGEVVGEGKVDLLVEGKVIVELKTVEMLALIHTAQMISYLRATKLKLGLIINFNVRALKDGIKRVAH
jgi:GxxExxY protein